MIIVKTQEQIDGIKESCKVLSYVLKNLKVLVTPDATTYDLNCMAEMLIIRNGCIPGFKGYKGYPYTICTSVNNELVHGFPNKKPLLEGDILSIDTGVVKKGWCSDAAFTTYVGKGSNKIIDVGKKCLEEGIKKATPGNRVGDISYAIQDTAEKYGYYVSKKYTGHGIGKRLHEPPQIPNVGKKHEGYMLIPGMVIAVEPIIKTSDERSYVSENGWTVMTKDGSLTSHFEHTVLITETGNEVLTLY